MQKIGQLGEDLASEYLKKRGYSILVRNYRKPWGEIDIVAKAQNGTLVFVEVKTLKIAENGLLPEDNLTSGKLQKFKRICGTFVAKHPEMIEEEQGWRIDLVAIDLKQGQPATWWEKILTKYKEDYVIRHYENI